jgi:hypothetical protein
MGKATKKARTRLPRRETIQLFLGGVGEHEHLPLYDLLLHEWLRLTNGNFHPSH